MPKVRTLSKSESLYQRALKVMPGGCSRNTVLHSPHPFYAVKGEGCYVTDIDDVKRIDFANNMASLIHGHSHPIVVNAVTQQIRKGTAYTLATEEEVLYAEYMCNRNAGFEKIRFVNSGTEAVMACLKAARAYTGKTKIAKVEGAYHGLYDYAEVSQNSTPENWGDVNNPTRTEVTFSTPQSALDDVVVIPFNDVKRAKVILNEYASELACVLIDLMPHRAGLIPASEEFVRMLRQWTQENDALLIYDEVVTFRLNYGGAQQWFDIFPDLSALGKMIGGGFPVGAIVGRADVMDVLNPLVENVRFPHAGTFSANPVTMTAGRVAMELYDMDAVKKLNKLGDYARSHIKRAINIADVNAVVTGNGSMFRIHFKSDSPENYRDSFPTKEELKKRHWLINDLFNNGIILINTCTGALSTAITKNEIDCLADKILNAFRRMPDIKDM